ncbi:MAG: methylmalonyl-CoA mutase family protein [Planctomycetota bacterium]|nr:methylmalonyl-CoA mutase family protein [Planctomycetota bacterium]
MAVDETAKRAFESASQAQWREQVNKTLRDKTDKDLAWTIRDGVRIEPLHGPGNLGQLPHITSGATALLRHSRSRAIRQQIDLATPAAAGRLVRQCLERGADDLLIRLDHLARVGIDPLTFAEDWERFDIFEHDAGADGCAIYHVEALETVLEAVDMAVTPIAFDAGASSLALLYMLFAIADRRGVAFEDLHIELGLDPIHELVRGAPLGSAHGDLLGEVSLAVEHTAELPWFVPLAVHSAGIHEAGASPAVELGYSIASGIEYVRHLLSDGSGLGIDADRACSSLCFRFHVDTELYVEIAKLRAARLLWAKVARSFGASDLQTKIHAESSTRSRARDDVHTNLLRTGIHGIAATLADCDSVALAPFEQTCGKDAESAHSLARNQQILLREESHLHRVQDPCGGSYSVETLTDAIAREAWNFVREIETAGGITQALRDGTVQARARECAEQRRDEVNHRQRTLVGINRFVDPGISRQQVSEPDSDQIKADLDEYLSKRDAKALESVLAKETIISIEAAKAGSTLGEMMSILRSEFDLSLETPFLQSGPDGAPFEQLRELVGASGLRVLPILTGPAKASRPRLEFARDYFTAGGFEVLPHHDGVDVDALRELDPDFAVLCSDDASHQDAVKKLPPGLRIVVVGQARDSLSTTVTAFIHADDNSYLTLRSLFLATCEDPEADGESGGTA